MIPLGQDGLQRPGGHDPARREHEPVGEPGRDLLEVVRDEDDRRGSWCRREPREVREQRLARARGRGWPRARRGAGGPDPASAPGRSRPAGARRRTASRAAGPRSRPTPRSARSERARARSASPYSCHHGSVAALRAVITTSTGREVVAQDGLDGTPRRADPAPQLAAVDPAVARPEDLHRPGGRPQRHAGDGQERGLARAVRPEHHPALARRGPSSRAVRGSSAGRAGPRGP